jgi:hypothetical protein
VFPVSLRGFLSALLGMTGLDSRGRGRSRPFLCRPLTSPECIYKIFRGKRNVEHKHTIVVFQWRHVEQKFRPASQDILSANIVCLHASRLSPSSRSRIYIKICIRGKVCCFQPAVVARWSGDENLETYMWSTQAGHFTMELAREVVHFQC